MIWMSTSQQGSCYFWTDVVDTMWGEPECCIIHYCSFTQIKSSMLDWSSKACSCCQKLEASSSLETRNRPGPRMGPWETSALMRHSCKDLPSRTTQKFFVTETWRDKDKHLNWRSIRFEFVKETNFPNSAKNCGYIKCYRSSCLRRVKNPKLLPQIRLQI